MGKRYVELERNQVLTIQWKYSCARCWTPIIVGHDERGDFLSCGDDECRCEGLIKTSSVEYMIQKNELLAREAREVLQVHFEWLRTPKRKKLSTSDYLKELGF
jgi:hypothetical protein